MRILLANDDGVYAPGISSLKKAMSSLGEVMIVAPDAERSAAAHSITLDRPLRVREVYVGDEFLGYAVDGSPADCVKIGVKQILDEPPDLVVSGINLGANVGINVLYSGTVAAALEGVILGITSVAVSLEGSQKPDFDGAAAVAESVTRQILARAGRKACLYNINIPSCRRAEMKGVAVARQSTVSYEDGFDMRTDPRGGRYYWMTGEMHMEKLPPDTDMALLDEGYVTVTALQYDLTDGSALAEADGWGLSV